MNAQHLPNLIDPIQLARAKQQLVGSCRLSELPRIQAIADQRDGVVYYDLQFGQDDNRKYFIKGCMQASVWLICQRCNKPVEIQIDTNVSLSPIVSESQAVNLPAEYEPLVTQGEPVSFKAILEEELLLALPMSVKHSVGECPAELPDYLRY